MNNFWILAVADQEGQVISSESPEGRVEETITQQAPGDSGLTDTPVQRSAPSLMQFLPLVLIFVVMYLLLFRGPKKKQQQHNKMVQSLQKNDKVRTIGGVLGTVIDVKDDEIILKVDESNNTKIRITPGAVSTVLSDECD